MGFAVPRGDYKGVYGTHECGVVHLITPLVVCQTYSVGQMGLMGPSLSLFIIIFIFLISLIFTIIFVMLFITHSYIYIYSN